MRIATCRANDDKHIALVGENKILVPGLSDAWPRELDDMLTLIDAGTAALERLAVLAKQQERGQWIPLSKAELLAPIPRPRKNIVCLGWNYREHAEETAAARGRIVKLPEHPIVFTKAVTTVAGPFDSIPYDERVSSELDWEVELGVIIGKKGRAISTGEALDYVFGYTVINDISARDMQMRHKQFFLGKSLDGSCPMGPWIVTKDEIPNPQVLDLSCRVNGALKQSANTDQQIFSVSELIATLSRGMTLEPGDIIATGTPSGVGFARTPPEYLGPGDCVECEIQGIGLIRNTFVERG